MLTRGPSLPLGRRLCFKSATLTSPHRFRTLALYVLARQVKRTFPTGRPISLVVEGGIGDFVLALPAIRRMVNQHPISLLAVEAPIVEFSRWFVPNVTVVDTTDLNRLVGLLRPTDVAVLAISLRTAGVLWRSRLSIVLWSNPRRKSHLHKTVQILQEVHAQEAVCRSAETEAGFQDRRATDRRILVIKAGQSDLRSWPVDRWIQVVGHFSVRHEIYLVGNKAEWERSEAIRIGAGASNVHNVCGQTSPRGLLTLLAESAGVISTDSGIAHLAGALNRPTVALFGPVDPNVWGPGGSDTTILYSHRWCSPCQQNYCPYKPGLRCMDDISADDVIQALEGKIVALQRGSTLL